MSSHCTFLNEKLYQYMLDHSLREQPILQELFAYNETLPQGYMQTSLEQVQFIQLLVKLIGAKNTIEVGVYTGMSALATALALPDDGKVVACDINEEWTNIARDYWDKAKVSHKVDLKLAPAEETLQKLIDDQKGEMFDMAYIDADKSNYTKYYELCLKLIKRNGLILLDNTFMHGGVVEENNTEKSVKGINVSNEKIFADERVDISILPIGDGLTIARKR